MCVWLQISFTLSRVSPPYHQTRRITPAGSIQSNTVFVESGLWRSCFEYDEAPLLSTGPSPYHHGFEHLLHLHHRLLHPHQADQLSAAPDVWRGRSGGPEQRLRSHQGSREEKQCVGLLPARQHQVNPHRPMYSPETKINLKVAEKNGKVVLPLLMYWTAFREIYRVYGH